MVGSSANVYDCSGRMVLLTHVMRVYALSDDLMLLLPANSDLTSTDHAPS